MRANRILLTLLLALLPYVTETSGLMVAMNWGDGDMNNDEVYSPTGSWATNGYYYDTGRHMVSQFSAY